MQEEKIFTVLIPAYNMEKWIGKTIESVLKNKNSEKYIDILVINDGSTDNTINVVKTYQNKYNNISLINKPNANWGSVINYAKNNKCIKTKYAMILDADDRIAPKMLDILIKQIDKSNFDLVFFKTKVFWYKKLSVIIDPRLFSKRNTFFSPVVIPCSTVFKTELLYQIDDLVEKVSYQDYPMFYKMIKIAKKIRFINRVGGIYWFSRPNNTMTSAWNEKRMNVESIMLEELCKINYEFLFIARLILPNYIQGISKSNIIMQINKADYQKMLSLASWFFKSIFKSKIQRALRKNCAEFVDTRTRLIYKDDAKSANKNS
ncbi:glycosyltransferase family 2 protein [Mycoplasmopsis primatum]|uniref:glycosyltransferase family 2 protein n=1 Tax=Mycoplasmopsis primatum TaxID=55604 RepID=UPI000A05C9AD|nr:glycosyltransferase family 2 protein [Mycoplasmopsis primatum]